jgi:hypothetical protein
MGNRIIYIDESGQEGVRLEDFTQNYYILVGLEEGPYTNIKSVEKVLNKNLKFKYRQGEIKFTTLKKNKNNFEYILEILNSVINEGYKIYLAVVQKETRPILTL